MVKRAKYITRITRDGDFTRMDLTMVDPPDCPRALGTSNPPFEQIKHLMSSRPYDLGGRTRATAVASAVARTAAGAGSAPARLREQRSA